MNGSIVIVGTGPGNLEWIAPAARTALENADVIIGYATYLDLIRDIAPHIPRESSGMHREIERARRAIELARADKRVAVVSGGDPGIYGMAGLILELLGENPDQIPVQVLPGISALNAAAALLGAPLMTDFAVISLSDQLIPLEGILRRVEGAVRAGFVLCLYNPRSHKRTEPFEHTCQILLKHLPADVPVGIVQAAYRRDQQTRIIRLDELSTASVGMDTLIIIGNSTTRVLDGKMVTARGYANKYALGESA